MLRVTLVRSSSLLLACVAPLVVGCAHSIEGKPSVVDAGVQPVDGGALGADASALDASVQDASVQDASVQDAGVIDGAAPQADAALDASFVMLPPTTAALTGPGLSTCGPNGGESCATTILVPGGTYPVLLEPATPATVSPYRLDKYKVTVGRFRKFVAEWLGGWRPAEGAGKHVHLNGGRGLLRTQGGYEAGWSTAWNGWVGASRQASQPLTSIDATTWNTSLSGENTISTQYVSWTPSPTTQESWPINGTNWYEALAFCIWDGGFLPSEIEWDHAAVGGTEGRFFPWGADPVSPSRALYGVTRLEPVGGKPAGNGRWGHADLLGMLSEFVYDVRVTQYAANCTDCAHDDVNGERTTRGWNFRVAEGTLTSFGAIARSGAYVGDRGYAYGFRCARTGKL